MDCSLQNKTLDLILISADEKVVLPAVHEGISTILIDCESQGKQRRQQGYDTLISTHTFDDLRNIRAKTTAHLICRLNPLHPHSQEEVEQAIDAGIDELLCPMIRTEEEVEYWLSLLQGRIPLGIMIETQAACLIAPQLGKYPLSRAFLGLNDLMIDRGHPSLFHPLIDGTLESVRSFFSIPFGFGGLTLPGKGSPIPCELLLGEMLRLHCDFTFLRRSFLKDIQGKDLSLEIPRMKQWMETMSNRSFDKIASDRRQLELSIL